MTRTNKKISVIWKDAVIFEQSSKIPKSLPTITTTGTLINSSDNFLILYKTHSTSNQSKMLPLKSNANFFFIPKAVIVKITEL